MKYSDLDVALKKIKKFGIEVISILAFLFGLLVVGVIGYKLEQLTDVSRPILKLLDEGSFQGFDWWHAVVIFIALLFASLMIFILQFFKSLYDQTIKKELDVVASQIVNKFK